MAVGAGGAITVGENGFGSLGSMRGAFSVGSAGGGGGGVVVVVVVVVVVSGASGSSSLAQDALSPTIAMMAALPAATERRRAKRLDVMVCPICPPTGESNRDEFMVEKTLSDGRKIPHVITRLLDGVGGRVFTHRIEHIFE